MNPSLPEAFRHYVGLSSIALVDEHPDGAELPADSRLQPIDASVEVRLRTLLQADTFDGLMLEAVRPKVYDRAVLAPSRFHALRDQVENRLRTLALTTIDPEQKTELRNASTLLQTLAAQHELGEALRYALLKG